jgi:hypothetical protein
MIVGWGLNDNGQAMPPDGNNFIAIAAGLRHNLALCKDGSIVGWGANQDGQATPPPGNDYVAIAAGSSHNLALRSDGSIIGWGSNGYGRATPPAGNDFVAIAAGSSHSLAIRSERPIEVAMRLTPKVLNCKGRGKWVKTHFVLPADLTVEDVDSNILGRIDSLGLEADYMDVFAGENGLVRIEMGFDHSAFCDALTEGGSIEITVKGFLTNSKYFYGKDIIKIIDNIF